MRKISIYGLILFFAAAAAFLVWWQGSRENKLIAPPKTEITAESSEKLLAKYTFENLKKRGGVAGTIQLLDDIPLTEEAEGFTSRLFSFSSDGRKITGLANFPVASSNLANLPNLANSEETTPSGKEDATSSATPEFSAPLSITNNYDNNYKFPVIIMIRGYVDQPDYEPGVGTKRAGEFFAQNGFITLAPDFLGYAGSDKPPDNVWEERFLRLTAVMDLIASVQALKDSPSTELRANSDKIGIWGHSNGGLIALSVLELTGGTYPTVLWAPVSQSFPYDILYYTYEFEDKGKALRTALYEFEKDYDVNLYSFDNYLDWIKAPIQIHQGSADEFIPMWWTNDLAANLKKAGVSAAYYKYTGADHNLSGVWEKVVQRDLDFFRQSL